MINKRLNFTDSVFSVLLDGYQMFGDWGMNWRRYIEQAQKEMNEAMERWKNEDVDEEGEG